METVLITGASGFIGVNVVKHFLQFSGMKIIAMCSSNDHKLKHQEGPRLKVIKHSLADNRVDPYSMAKLLESECDIHSVKYVINLASNSDIGMSVDFPNDSWFVNCMTIAKILSIGKRLPSLKKFIHVSSNAIFGDCVNQKLMGLWEPAVPSTPYAAGKAAQEALAISYWKSYALPLVICNTMCVIGDGQHESKFIPSTIRKVLKGQTVCVYEGTRSYIDVRDVARSFLHILNHHSPVLAGKDISRPSKFNVCGNTPYGNLELAELIARKLGKKLYHSTMTSPAPWYDMAYKMDNAGLFEIGFNLKYTMEDTLDCVIAKYR